MLYYANPSTAGIRDVMTRGELGCIITPAQSPRTALGKRRAPLGAVWCADNGAYGKGWPGADLWWSWVEQLPDRDLCGFVVAPDVVENAPATLELAEKWLPRIHELGLPAAFVAQDGQEDLPLPDAPFSTLFLGGSTSWKLGPAARELTTQARAHGLAVHMGRVNSRRRMQYAAAIGCTSADGTLLTYGPDFQLPRLLSWLREIDTQGVLGP